MLAVIPSWNLQRTARKCGERPNLLNMSNNINSVLLTVSNAFTAHFPCDRVLPGHGIGVLSIRYTGWQSLGYTVLPYEPHSFHTLVHEWGRCCFRQTSLMLTATETKSFHRSFLDM